MACGWLAKGSRRFRVTCPDVYGAGVVPPATLQPGGHLARAPGPRGCVALVPSVRVRTRRGRVAADNPTGGDGAPGRCTARPGRRGAGLPGAGRATGPSGAPGPSDVTARPRRTPRP